MAQTGKPADSLAPKAQWRRFVSEFRLDANEQTRLKELRPLVQAGKWYEAVAELAQQRGREIQNARSQKTTDASNVATHSERKIAEFLSRRLAKRISADSEVTDLRRVLLGAPEPVTPARAWEILDDPESPVAGDHHDGPLARLAFPPACRSRDIVARLTFKRAGELVNQNLPPWQLAQLSAMRAGEVLVPRNGPLLELAQYFHRWPESDAAWFLLTGAPPLIPPISWEVDRNRGESPFHVRIRLTTMGHVSPETVARVSEMARRELFNRPRGLLLPEHLAMAEFVEDERARTGELPPWRDLLKEWNRIAPREWQWTKPPESMSRVYSRVMEVKAQQFKHFPPSAKRIPPSSRGGSE